MLNFFKTWEFYDSIFVWKIASLAKKDLEYVLD